jgi:primase-polymerase (primpol)-like protein
MSDLSDHRRPCAVGALPDELKALWQWVVWKYERATRSYMR